MQTAKTMDHKAIRRRVMAGMPSISQLRPSLPAFSRLRLMSMEYALLAQLRMKKP